MRKIGVVVSMLLLALAAAAEGPPQQSQAKIIQPKSTITVTMGGINCSTTAGTNAFFAESWSWGAMAPIDTATGLATGRATVSPLMVQKKFDQCSPELFGAVVTGKRFSTMTLVQEDGSNNVVLTLKLTNAMVTSWNIGGSTSQALPLESIGINFEKVCISEPSTSATVCYSSTLGK